MRIERLSWTDGDGWTGIGGPDSACNLVLYFGRRAALRSGDRFEEMRRLFPAAHLLGCSTGGQIANEEILDDEIAALAMTFDATALRLACETVSGADQSHACGESIGRALDTDGLAGIFILSDGLAVNGSELVAGIASVVGQDIPVTGGLAGDDAEFQETLVGGDCAPRNRTVAAVDFYGTAIRIGHGNAGGWDQFGPRRRITHSRGNVLFELDGEPALDLYEKYLGEEAADLPGSALLFPLRIEDPTNRDNDLVRTVLSVDRDARSMTFAGDVPVGWVGQLMRGNFDRLAAGAADAARQANTPFTDTIAGDRAAILVSCIGRRLLMGQHIVNEIEAAGSELGADFKRLGFYSYGEISPHSASGVCQLHNQTMTITTLAEAIGPSRA